MEPKVEKSFRLIYEDENLAVVDKPGNLPCHPGGSYCENTLLHLLRNAGIAQPFIINRLDRETSGIVLVAKNGETAKSLAGQFKRHTVEKEYTVLVHGAFPQKLSAKGWLTHDDASVIVKKRKFVETADAPDDKAESAETDFELAATEGMYTGQFHARRVMRTLADVQRLRTTHGCTSSGSVERHVARLGQLRNGEGVHLAALEGRLRPAR